MHGRHVAALGLILSFVLGGALLISRSTPRSDDVRVALGDTTVTVEVADDAAEREHGLSGHAPLSDSEGMLFVFQDDGEHMFWMKDMLFAIDMIWFDAEKRVIYTAASATPESYPATFGPGVPSRYVLEVPAGWAARHNVATGSVARF